MRLVCFLILTLFPLSLSAQTDPFISTIETVNRSILPVACASNPDEKAHVDIKGIKGTGFFINFEGDFITAAHVIDEFHWNTKGIPDPDCFPIIYVPHPTWEHATWFQFRSCTTDSALDIAVCHTSVNPFLNPDLHISRLHLSATVPKDGTPVAFTGFPQFILQPITTRANIAASGQFLAVGQFDLVLDKTAWHGVSGGPVYTSDGEVIGIIRRRGETVLDGMSFARETAGVIDFLTKNNISIWQEEKTKNK